MWCLASTQRGSGENRRWPKNIGEVAVYVPGIRIPKPVDFSQPLTDGLSRNLVERLSALRTRIVVMAGQEAPMATKPRRAATQHGGSTLADLQQALEDYLPVLLGLAQNGSQMQYQVHFSWLNQEDTAEETTMSSSWYEVLSVLHLMAVLSLSQANLLLLPITTANDAHLSKLSEERRRTCIDILLKAAGYLEFCIQHVLPQFSPELRKDLPLDLTERVLQALCMQALGQVVDVQLGMAIESVKATLAVKRRLACEMVKYWNQAQENTLNLPLANGWAEKHKLFIQWKYTEAKAAAYYYHGSILDEGNTEISEEMAVTAQQAAEVFHKESKKACDYFHMTPPLSRNPTLWGTGKFLSEKILARDNKPKKPQTNEDLLNHEMILRSAPALPDFALSLKPDEYQLPPVDASWNTHLQTQIAVSAQQQQAPTT